MIAHKVIAVIALTIMLRALLLRNDPYNCVAIRMRYAKLGWANIQCRLLHKYSEEQSTVVISIKIDTSEKWIIRALRYEMCTWNYRDAVQYKKDRRDSEKPHPSTNYLMWHTD